jgi:hypothetical protein
LAFVDSSCVHTEVKPDRGGFNGDDPTAKEHIIFSAVVEMLDKTGKLQKDTAGRACMRLPVQSSDNKIHLFCINYRTDQTGIFSFYVNARLGHEAQSFFW